MEKEKRKGPGKPPIEPGVKRHGVSISMSPMIFKMVDNCSKIGSFSLKVENILTEYFAMKSLLVQYQDEQQRYDGTPVILNEYAERLYSCSTFMTGFNYSETQYADRIEQIMKSLHGNAKKGQDWVDRQFIPAVRNAGYVVQVINELEYDLYDVWFMYPMKGEGLINCSQCKVLKSIEEYIGKVKNER